MSEHFFALLYKMRFLLGSALIIVCLFLLSFLLSITTEPYKGHAAAVSSDASTYSGGSTADDPNVIADFMSTAGNKFMQTTSSTSQTLNGTLHSVTTSIVSLPVHGSKVAAGGIYSGTAFVAHGTGSVISTFAHGAGGTFSFVARVPSLMIHTPGRVLKFAAPSNIVGSAIRPADNTKVPVIREDQSDVPLAIGAPSSTTNPIAPASASSSDNSVQWPIHGAITTLFGVPELPYEAIHTGLDISDGNRPGVTPIRPFKAGKVIQVIHSSLGLGNHIVIDHGGGMTSVYGHLNSILVQEGQAVDKNTLLGYEGTTGASTGPHLHFEIRINGQAVNPLNYIPGRP
jgi:hypothetical protein